MIKFISPEQPGDQRNPALSTISPTVYPAPSCPCPCTVGPSLVKLLPRHGVVYPLPHCRFKQVLNYSLLLDNNPIQPCVFSLQILFVKTTFLVSTSSSAASFLESYLGHLFLQQCGFHLFWFNFQKLQSLLSFLLIFPYCFNCHLIENGQHSPYTFLSSAQHSENTCCSNHHE